MRWPCLVAALLLGGALTSRPAPAAPVYTIAFPGSTVNSGTPFMRDSSFALPAGGGPAVMTTWGYGSPGLAQGRGRIDVTWTTGGSGSFSGLMRTRSQATDFVITGPPGAYSVSGTLHLRFRASLGKDGGYAGNNGHGAQVIIRAGASTASIVGSYWLGNGTTGGTGVLTGATGPEVDATASITGTFYVGAPFTVFVQVEAGGYCYGNMYVSPGFVQADARGVDAGGLPRGLMLEEVGGQVMTLPEGYTLNSPSWDVVDNRLHGPLGVPAPREQAQPELVLAGENPSRGDTRFALTLPRDAHARVVVHDVAGRRMRIIDEGWLTAGRHQLAWDGEGDDARPVPAGIYFLRAEVEDVPRVLRVIRLR